MSRHALRMIAVLLVLTGVADFFSFDRQDMFGSMNNVQSTGQTGCMTQEMDRCSHPRGVNPAALPDDGCLFCGIGVPAAAVLVTFNPLIGAVKVHQVLTASALSPDF